MLKTQICVTRPQCVKIIGYCFYHLFCSSYEILISFLILGFLRQVIQKYLCACSRFAVMAYCWAMSADERPTFAQLHICLQEFYTQLTRYV